MAFWTVAQTESQRENTAARFLRQDNFETYLPKCRERKRISPLFPAYIFVRIVDRWYSIRWTIGVLRVLTFDDGLPARVPDDVVDKLRSREGHDGLIKLPKKRGLQVGDAVRVVRGSFAGQLALFDGMNGLDRSCVLLEMLGRKVPISLPTSDFVRIETNSSYCVS